MEKEPEVTPIPMEELKDEEITPFPLLEGWTIKIHWDDPSFGDD